MAKIPDYKKDPETGAIIFQDATAYIQRKKVIVSTKLAKKAEKESKRSINSMKREIKTLKKQVATSSALETRIRKLEEKNTESAEENN
jgi:prefoldin subunit 5